MTLPSTPHLVHNLHNHLLAMPTPSIYLRTPDTTPGSFVKLLWDFTCSTMSAIHPPQSELHKSRTTKTHKLKQRVAKTKGEGITDMSKRCAQIESIKFRLYCVLLNNYISQYIVRIRINSGRLFLLYEVG